jgi:hypothetical protein
MVGDFHQERAMVTMTLPVRVGPDLDTLHIRRPGPRDETVVDVKRALLLPLKIVGGLLFFAMSFAMKEMVAAHQAKLGEHFH